jgi:hypothetical protein
MSSALTDATIPQAEIGVDLDLSKPAPIVPAPEDGRTNRLRSKWWIASGIFLFVLALYVLTSPGRIDIVDGQARFDVSYNLLENGRPIVKDNWIGPFMGVPGRNGLRYSYYGAPASVFAIPLVWLGLYTSAPEIQPSQFLFSLTSSILGAGVAPILFLFYLELGATTRRAFAWTMVSSFATFIWPASNTTFDNAQHSFFALAAVYLGFLGARSKSATYAVAGGLMAGVLVLYQEYFLLIIPALALSTLEWEPGDSSFAPMPTTEPGSIVWRVVAAVKRAFQSASTLVCAAWDRPGEARSSCIRYCLFLTAVGVGVVLSLVYNDLRFGFYLENGKMRSITANAYPLFGNPLAGFLTLLVSPGKSIFLYSPPLVLGLLGMGSFWRRHREIAVAVLMASLSLVLFLSCICFVGGDWCWGPRYLAVLVPLWALVFPFVPLNRARRKLVVAIVGVGLLVQVMALSVENQRFFLENGFRDYFWAEDSWVYFKHSALFERVGEMMSLTDGLPPTARFFNSLPVTNWCTYTLLGPPPEMDRSLSPSWMRNYKIFYLPRPWPLWMSYLPPPQRPVDLDAWLVGLLGLVGLGAGLIYRGFKTGNANE